MHTHICCHFIVITTQEHFCFVVTVLSSTPPCHPFTIHPVICHVNITRYSLKLCVIFQNNFPFRESNPFKKAIWWKNKKWTMPPAVRESFGLEPKLYEELNWLMSFSQVSILLKTKALWESSKKQLVHACPCLSQCLEEYSQNMSLLCLINKN